MVARVRLYAGRGKGQDTGHDLRVRDHLAPVLPWGSEPVSAGTLFGAWRNANADIHYGPTDHDCPHRR